ncbi:MAG: hypothetical protein JSW66_10355 [Phycisphaerales bacterium]|nr:MAG: hypothetical protein JSW66_10355 [Phycisphaerales bacterium]
MKTRDQRRQTSDQGRGTRDERRFGHRPFVLSAIVMCLSSIVLLCVAGCQKAQKADYQMEIADCRLQIENLQSQIESLSAENKQLTEQVQVLSGLPEQVRLDSVRPLTGVKVGRFSGFYDKDKDGKKEKLIVYIEPMDEQGDRIKAPGTVDVQLWDLDKSADGALLGQWHVDAEQLRTSWFDTLLSTNYRCMFDMASPAENLSKSLTVKVTFTDTLTGRTFTDQRAIKPQQSK